jgi:hypothetical protein
MHEVPLGEAEQAVVKGGVTATNACWRSSSMSRRRPGQTPRQINDLNSPEPSHDGTAFCEAGTLLASNLIRVNHRATENFGVVEMDILKRAIDDAFEDVRMHWLSCAKRTEDEVV